MSELIETWNRIYPQPGHTLPLGMAGGVEGVMVQVPQYDWKLNPEGGGGGAGIPRQWGCGPEP